MSDTNVQSAPWEPRIVAFFCNWCTYTAADLAGVSRMKYAPNTRIIRLMCSGRVDPQFILAALAGDADGVLIGGCHIGDCHYSEGNLKTLRRFQLLKRMLADFGIEDQRVRLEWISASEGERAGVRWLFAFPSVTAKISGLSRLPLQTSQNCGLM